MPDMKIKMTSQQSIPIDDLRLVPGAVGVGRLTVPIIEATMVMENKHFDGIFVKSNEDTQNCYVVLGQGIDTKKFKVGQEAQLNGHSVTITNVQDEPNTFMEGIWDTWGGLTAFAVSSVIATAGVIISRMSITAGTGLTGLAVAGAMTITSLLGRFATVTAGTVALGAGIYVCYNGYQASQNLDLASMQEIVDLQ